MKYGWLGIGLWLLAAVLMAQTETVSGTVNNPDGSGFNGTFNISLAKSTVVNTCVSPAQVIPFPGIPVKVTNGTFTSTQLLPTSCLSPSIPYFIRVVNSLNQPVYTDNWYIPQMLGSAVNIGDLGEVKMASGITVAVPSAIVGTPVGNQTVTQPAGTNLIVNNLLVNTTLSGSGVTAAVLPAIAGQPIAPSSVTFPDLTVLNTSYGTGSFAYSGVLEFGDSITYGDGATALGNGYGNLMLPLFGGGDNNGYPGDRSADETEKMLTDIPLPHYYSSGAVTAMIGTNDLYFCGNTSDCLNNFYHANMAAFVYALTPQEDQIYFGTNSTAVSSTGTWTQDSAFQADLGLATVVNGSSVTFTTFLPSKSLVVAFYGENSNTSSAALSCDGGAVTDTLTTAGYTTINFNSGDSVTVFANLYSFSAATTHSCTITASASGGNPFTLLYAATPPPTTYSSFGSPTVNPPRLFVGGVIRQVITSPPYSETDATGTAAYDANQHSLIEALNGAGWSNVTFVNVREYLFIPQDMSGAITNLSNGLSCPASTQTGLHPNDCGHKHLEDAFLEAAQPVAAVTAAGNSANTWSTPFTVNAPAATSLAGFSTLNGLNNFPGSYGAALGNGFLIGEAGGAAFGVRLGLSSGDTYNYDIFTSNNFDQGVRFCSFVNGSYPTLNSDFTCLFKFDNQTGQLTMGPPASPATIGGYHNFNTVPNVGGGSSLTAGISLLDTSGLNFGIQVGYNSAGGGYDSDLYAPDGHPVGFAHYNAGSGEPSGGSGFTNEFFCTDTACTNNVPINGAQLLSGTTGTLTGTALTATCDSGTASVSGAIVGHPVAVGSTTGADVGGAFDLRASVTSTGTVTVYVCGTGTPSTLAYNVIVF